MKSPKRFYYIAHKDNLKSMLKHGILSRTNASAWRIPFLSGPKQVGDIHDKGIIEKRKNSRTFNEQFKGRTLWDYANVYFQGRNPMLYRVVKAHGQDNIAVLEINPDILKGDDVVVTDGNAASSATRFFENAREGLAALDPNQFEKDHWNEGDKRKFMAELLVYGKIPSEKIMAIHVASPKAALDIKKAIGMGALNVVSSPSMFFQPAYKKSIADNVTLAKGDMFFSKMQTFTISVNTVGVMGKGLASRAKYQFPDVYVQYQDVCRDKRLSMGKPFLYKRDDDFTRMLSEDTDAIISENGSRWFLLFPTKNHWRTDSPIEGIEKGLRWLVDNHGTSGIRSLALPALGCGLGGLDWKDVGPLMCGYVKRMGIQTCIYLPFERDVPAEQLEPDFLLGP